MSPTPTLRWLLIAIAVTAACGKDRASSRPGTELVFTDSAGRTLHRKDLAGVSGMVAWEIVGHEQVPAEAEQLHADARTAGAAGDYDQALALLERARALAPAWPYPVYDAAYTYLLKGDLAGAEQRYLEVDKLAPRGFFTCKTSIDCLRREREGALPAGFCRAFAMSEWLEPTERKAALTEMLARVPDYAPAWHELSEALDDDAARLRAIEHGLEGAPDPETRGLLLINKALLLQDRDRPAAIRILGELALDPASTLATEQLAKASLAQVVGA